MRAGIIENGVIANIIEVDSVEDMPLFDAVELREDACIGDEYIPPEPPAEPEEEPSVWDELDAAYQAGYNKGYEEGVNTAYDQ